MTAVKSLVLAALLVASFLDAAALWARAAWLDPVCGLLLAIALPGGADLFAIYCAEREAARRWAWLSDMWGPSLNRRAEVEQLMFDAARGKRPVPSQQELHEWATRLGVPDAARRR